jgi:hypothetical protein
MFSFVEVRFSAVARFRTITLRAPSEGPPYLTDREGERAWGSMSLPSYAVSSVVRNRVLVIVIPLRNFSEVSLARIGLSLSVADLEIKTMSSKGFCSIPIPERKGEYVQKIACTHV